MEKEVEKEVEIEAASGVEVPGSRSLGLSRAVVGPSARAAGWFGANTAGPWWCSWFRPDRQRMKANGTDLGARRLLAASAEELWVLRPWGAVVGRGVVARWRRSDVVARPVSSRQEAGLIALQLALRSNGQALAELRPLDPGAWQLMSWLLHLPVARGEAGRHDSGDARGRNTWSER